MKYQVAKFAISGTSDKQTACDLLAALSAEAGFETFEESEEGLTAWVQKEEFDKDILDEVIATFPLVGTTIEYTIEDAEDRNWNEKWEETGWEPIVIDDKCVRHIQGLVHRVKCHDERVGHCGLRPSGAKEQ